MDNLKKKFGKRKINEKEKTSLVQEVFSKVSKQYDLMNDIMSFGTHRLWKKIFVENLNIQKNDIIIDVGSGTGDIAKIIFDKYKSPSLHCVDLNLEMINEGKKKFKKSKNNINFYNYNAEKLPFEDNFFDKYLISFCLRNITHPKLALFEALRVLKPGGSFHCLEFSVPTSSLINNIYSKYKKNIIPIMGKKIAKNKNAYSYLQESISNFPNQEILLSEMQKIGFENVNYTNLFDGIVSIHIGYKT